MSSFRFVNAVALVAVLWLGCGASGGGLSPSASHGAPSRAARGAADAGARIDAASTSDSELALATPSDGFLVRDVGAPIAAATDAEYCEVAELPGDPSQTYYVKSIELANGVHSHHLIVSAAVPGSAADAKLRALNVGDRMPCLSAEQSFGPAGIEGVGGTQQPYGRIEFPDGVGRVYYGAQRIVFDYHYLNTSEEVVMARSAVAFHLTDRASVQHLARSFGFYNFTIDTPAGATASFEGECGFTQDVMVKSVTRHTHRWGTDYSVWYYGGARDGELVWTSHDWQHDVDYAFDAPVLVPAGEGFRFRCNYQNTEDHDLRFGTQASDEMCILFGMIWNAGDGVDVSPQRCDITWTDADGIGRSATDPSFPKPTESDRMLCTSGSAQKGPLDACAQCRCDACAAPILGCVEDGECKAIVDCVSKAGCDAQAVVDAHSSAAGLLTQMQRCIQVQCPVCNGG